MKISRIWAIHVQEIFANFWRVELLHGTISRYSQKFPASKDLLFHSILRDMIDHRDPCVPTAKNVSTCKPLAFKHVDTIGEVCWQSNYIII